MSRIFSGHVSSNDAEATERTALKVFISYSRKDGDFAQELLAGLELAGCEPYLDKHDIAAGEDWDLRLGRLIEAADTVVFVISPDSVTSERCAWEVERTVTLKKRLLPIVWRAVEEAHVPERLKQLNYIYFDKPHSFGPSTVALAGALRTDLGWIREHTRIGEAALRWNGRGRSEALLFRGDELAAAKAWLANPPQYAPEPTLLHHEFIEGGADAEAARVDVEHQRLKQMAAALEREKSALRIGRRALAVAAIFLAGMGGIGWLAYETFLTKESLKTFKDLVERGWQTQGEPPQPLNVSQEKLLKAGDIVWECLNCPEMVVLPMGEFVMGSPEGEASRKKQEGPQRKVVLPQPLAAGKFNVTFDQWDGCVAYGGCTYRQGMDAGWGRGNRPVINVSWDDAKQYVSWLARLTGKPYRLLSESEWEYAARAGTTTVYPWGDEIGHDQANCVGCGSQWDKQTTLVGSFKPNAWGLYEMHGNVWQWVEDCYEDNYNGAPTDGSAVSPKDCSARVLRGGSWKDGPGYLLSASRGQNVAGMRSNSIGFRVGRTL